MYKELNTGGQPGNPDNVPGRRDMTRFEEMYVADAVTGPVEQWAVLWPEGRVMLVSDEDAALVVARVTPRVRIVHRWVSQWSPPGAA